jgi:hypothetical protein
VAALADSAVGATTLSLTLRYTESYLTGSPGPLSSGGCGRASPVVPGGRSLLVCLVSTRWIVVANAAITATARTAAKTAKVICVRRRLLQLRSLFMGNTFLNLNQRNSLNQVPPSAGVGTGSLARTGDRLRSRCSPHAGVGNQRLDDVGHEPARMSFPNLTTRLTRQLRDFADLR